jgi:hypothetical protein
MNIKTKDELVLEAFEKTKYDKAKKVVEKAKKEGLVIYVDFKTKKVIGYGKS